MGYRLNRLDEPVFMAVSKPLLTEFGIYHRLESCAMQRILRAAIINEHLRLLVTFLHFQNAHSA